LEALPTVQAARNAGVVLAGKTGAAFSAQTAATIVATLLTFTTAAPFTEGGFARRQPSRTFRALGIRSAEQTHVSATIGAALIGTNSGAVRLTQRHTFARLANRFHGQQCAVDQFPLQTVVSADFQLDFIYAVGLSRHTVQVGDALPAGAVRTFGTGYRLHVPGAALLALLDPTAYTLLGSRNAQVVPAGTAAGVAPFAIFTMVVFQALLAQIVLYVAMEIFGAIFVGETGRIRQFANMVDAHKSVGAVPISGTLNAKTQVRVTNLPFRAIFVTPAGRRRHTLLSNAHFVVAAMPVLIAVNAHPKVGKAVLAVRAVVIHIAGCHRRNILGHIQGCVPHNNIRMRNGDTVSEDEPLPSPVRSGTTYKAG